MSDIGRPRAFSVDHYLDCVETMILADEVQRALWMLDNLPGFYRAPENYPERAKEIKKSLHEAFFTPVEYAQADREADQIENVEDYWPHRAQVLGDTIKALNDEGKSPHLMEVGAGSNWLFKALDRREYKFTYESRGLTHHKTSALPGSPNIFIGFELIEHLWQEIELYQSYLKFKKEAQYIFLSTPLFTYGGGLSLWRGQALGHLRTYSSQEFFDVVRKMFLGFKWQAHVSDTTTLVGVRE